MEKSTKLEKVIGQISSWGNFIGSWGLFVLMCIGVVAVGLRWAGIPLGGAINLSVYILVAVIYFSLAYAQLKDENVAVELVVNRFRGRSRQLIIIIALLISLVACFFLVWSSCKSTWLSWSVRERMDGAPFYPIYPSKIALAIGVVLLFLQLLADFIKAVRQYRHVK